ncbi:hypothetical protein B1813_22520 [Saccharomonospora piscinae]|uniref:HTH luxR-type domain-containing protein n=1 Tax=Saccharomonospora piscinae TaxID=687388 RepID=A0A1V8ZXZ9_SACPI|nr:AAA family ATPase [Saccharomonospora piscinae]OQO89678.1 hypothetical protein B1813_22520 [Saccharomonospora piscinae]
MSLVDRDEQVRALDHFLAESAAGRGAVVSLEGPVACGRTALLRTFCRRAEASGALVLSATCSGTERELPFAALRQLLHHPDVPRELARLPQVGAPAGEVTPELALTLHTVWHGVRELATERPVVLAVDNIASADPVTQRCLLYLAGRLEVAPVLLVLTDDVESSRTHLRFRAELLGQAGFHRLRFGPLSPCGVGELLARRWERSTVARLAPELHRLSGGNPLLVQALADDYDATGAERADGYGLAVLSLSQRGEPPAPRVVAGLAVLGDDAEPGLVADLIGADADEVGRSIRAMTAAGLLAEGTLPHPVARRAVLDAMPSDERAELHRAAGSVRHAHGAQATAVARHLVDAGSLDGDRRRGSDGWAIEVLTDAAESATAGGDLSFAVACLRLAHETEAGGTLTASLLARLVDAEWRLNPARAASHLSRLVTVTLAGELGLADGLDVVRRLLWHGRDEEARKVLDGIRSGAVPSSDAGRLRQFETWLTLAHPRMADRDRRVPAQREVPAASGATDTWLSTAATMIELLAAGREAEAADSAERCLAGLPFRQLTSWAEEAAGLALQILVAADRLAVARLWCHRLLDDVQAGSAVTWRATLTAVLADVALRTGDLAGAVTHGTAALAALPLKAWGVTAGLPLSVLVLAATRQGDYAAVTEHLREPVTGAVFDSRFGPRYLHARGSYYLALDNGHRALADFLSCGELLRGWGLDFASLAPWRTSAAEAWLRVGNHDQARQLAYEQAARPDARGARTRALSLRMLAATGPADRRPELLTEALELLEHCGDRYEQAQVLAELSHGRHALGQTRRARMAFRRAWHLAETAGAAPLMQRLLNVEDRPAAVSAPLRVGTDAALTASEHRVASLAVLGCSNREIAGKLHITVSTVEQHLTRIYRKLKVKRRDDLPVELCLGAS